MEKQELSRMKKFRHAVAASGGRRLDLALDGATLNALEVVRLQRGFKHPREVFATLVREEQARLGNDVVAAATRPSLDALNAGVIARSLIASVPNASAADQRVLSDLLSALFRVVLETLRSEGGQPSLLGILTFVPFSDAAVERIVGLAMAAQGVSSATRRALTLQVEAFRSRDDRDALYDLLETAMEAMLWNGLLRD